MKKYIVRAAVIICMTAVMCFPWLSIGAEESLSYTGETADFSSLNEGKDCVEGELIVVFKEGVSDRKADGVIEDCDAVAEKDIELDESRSAKVVELPSDMTVEEGAEVFSEESSVQLVQPNYIYYAADEAASSESEYEELHYREEEGYQLTQSDIKGAWELLENRGYKKHTAKVAVIDGEIFNMHEDLSGITRYSVVGDTSSESALVEKSTHGTHVSGILSAEYGNGKGIAGVASGFGNSLADVIFIAASRSENGKSFYTEDVVSAINLAAEKGAEIISMSMTGNSRDRLLETVIKEKYDEGIIFVAASGNKNVDTEVNPADMKEVIGVNGASEAGEKWRTSNYGVLKDVSAAGEGVVSTVPSDRTGEYGKMTGTSMATPVVAGVAALVLDAAPELTPDEVCNILCSTAENSSGKFEKDGLAYGIVNAEAAVRAAHDADEAAEPDSIGIKEYTYERYDIEKDEFITCDGAAVYEGDTFGLESVRLPGGALAPVTWSSEDESIAVVDDIGRVTGVSPGETRVTAECGGKTAVCTVAVFAKAKVKIVSEKRKMTAGEKYSFKGSVTDEKGTKYTDVQSVVWSCCNAKSCESRPAVAKVDRNTGKVTALREGRAVLTMTAKVREYNTDLSESSPYAVHSYSHSITLVTGRKNYSGKDYRLKVRKTSRKAAALKWKKISVADRYVLYRATSAKGKYRKVKSVTAASVTDKGLKPGRRYWYRIKAVYGSRYFGYSSKVCALTKK